MAFNPKLYAQWSAQLEKHPPYLIPDLLPAQAIVLLSGHKKKTNKTFLAITISVCVASGKNCDVLAPELSGPVVYIASEGVAQEFDQRLRGVCKALELNPDELPIHVSFREGLKLDHAADERKVVSFCKTVRPLLVVLDTLTYLKKGDENNVQEMQVVVDTLQAIQNTGATVLVLAHLKKDSSPEANHNDEVRGSGIFTDIIDGHLYARKYDDDKAKAISLGFEGRGGDDAEYAVGWQIKTKKSKDANKRTRKEIVYARPTIFALHEPPRSLLDTFQPGEYNTKDFAELWSLTMDQTKKVLQIFADDGLINRAPGSKTKWVI